MTASAAALAPEFALAYRKWTCAVCDYVYDEETGDPDHGLVPGTRYEDIPDDWSCPDCGVTKADFYCFDD
ncbi:rubredoxin [Betaproteobacteria bacterium SCN1]|jgi:rubredoxin-NAD+ reductase|nr:rubredoxin [Betaproteobacteria bacterium SCN1]